MVIIEEDIHGIMERLEAQINEYLNQHMGNNQQAFVQGLYNIYRHYLQTKGILVEYHLKIVQSNNMDMCELIPLSLYGFLILNSITLSPDIVNEKSQYEYDGIIYGFTAGKGGYLIFPNVVHAIISDFVFKLE